MKFMFKVSTGYVGSEVEEIIDVPDRELEGMTVEEIDTYVFRTYYEDWLKMSVNINYYPVKE